MAKKGMKFNYNEDNFISASDSSSGVDTRFHDDYKYVKSYRTTDKKLADPTRMSEAEIKKAAKANLKSIMHAMRNK